MAYSVVSNVVCLFFSFKSLFLTHFLVWTYANFIILLCFLFITLELGLFFLNNINPSQVSGNINHYSNFDAFTFSTFFCFVLFLFIMFCFFILFVVVFIAFSRFCEFCFFFFVFFFWFVLFVVFYLS